MNKDILDIIDKKTAKAYANMTETKRRAYRYMLYAGVQITQIGSTLRAVAAEIGYSEPGASKLVHKFIELMKIGDLNVNRVIEAVRKLPKNKREKAEMPINPRPPQDLASLRMAEEEGPVTGEIILPDPVPTKPIKCNGFIFSVEDQMRERAAIRASILFFQTYGKGRQPRTDGQYYAPGTAPAERERSDRWLPLSEAALYCGCKQEVIVNAGQRGVIERRMYRRNAGRAYYEYSIKDLDKFIRDNNLL